MPHVSSTARHRARPSAPSLHSTPRRAHVRSATPRRAAATRTTFDAPRAAGLDSIKAGFATMEDRFQPAKAKGFDVRMQFELTGAGGGAWFVTIKDGRCTVTPGHGDDPDTTLRAAASDYLKIVNGEMNKVMALLRGKLRVQGDMGKVRPFFACFRRS